MSCTTYNIPSHYRGDTFPGVQFSLVEDDVTVDLTGATILAGFRSAAGEEHSMSSPSSGITITVAAGGLFTIDEQVIAWEPGVYEYDIQITLGSGDIKTSIAGTFEVLEDIAGTI